MSEVSEHYCHSYPFYLISVVFQMHPEIMGTDVYLSDTQVRELGPPRANSVGSREAVNTIASRSAAVRTPADVDDSLSANLTVDAEQDEPVEGISEGFRQLSIGTPANRYHGKYSTLVLISAAMDLRKRALQAQHGQPPPLWLRQGTRRSVSSKLLSDLARSP